MKKINVLVNAIDTLFKKQMQNLLNQKYNVNVNVNGTGVKNANDQMNQLGNSTKNVNTIFGKLKNIIGETFSTHRITMFAFLTVLKEINTASKEAVKTIKEVDKAVTDLSIATNMSREATAGLVKEYNAYAKELKSTTTQITSAADAYLRSGKTMSETQALIKDSIMLSKLGQIEASAATEDLLSTMNAYDMSIEELGKSLDAMVAIDMKASTSAGDIATALKYCASNADLAGLSFNKLISIIATIQHKTGQQAEVIGNTLNTVLSRYKNVKLGAITDDDGEDISNVETSLKQLGIQLRSSEQDFRDFDEIFNELGKNWNNYTEVQQSSIAKEIGGVRQMNRVIAMFEGYNKVLELTEVAANSAGTAVDKFNKAYADSLEAKSNTLKASFESMIMNSDMEKVYSGILEATTALVDFMNKTNALKGALTALSVGGAIKAFLSIKTGITQASISLTKFQTAIEMVRSSTNMSAIEFQKLLLLSNGLSKSQMQLIISTGSFTTAQKQALLIASGLTEEEAKQIITTNALAQSQRSATVSSAALGKSMKGLGTSLKAFASANALLLTITTIVTAVVVAKKAYDDFTVTVEEANDAMDEAVSNYESTKSELESINSELETNKQKIDELKSKGKLSYVEENELERLQAITEQLQLQYDITQRKAELEQSQAANKAVEAYNTQYSKNTVPVTQKGVNESLSLIDSTGGHVINAGENDIAANIANFQRFTQYANDAKKKLVDESKRLTKEEYDDLEAKTKAYEETALKSEENLTNALQSLSDKKSAMQDTYDRIIEKQKNGEDLKGYEQNVLDTYNTIVQNIELIYKYLDPEKYIEMKIPDILDNEGIEKTKEDLVEMAKAGELTPETLQDYYKLNKALVQSGISAKDCCAYLYKLAEAEEQVDDSTPDVSKAFTKEEMISAINDMSEGFEELDKIFESISDKDPFDFKLLDDDAFKETFSGLGQAYTDFIETITSSPDDINGCKEAFNDLIGAWVQSTGILSKVDDSTATLTVSMLKMMGVENADAIVTEALTANKIAEEYAIYDLTNATEDEIQAKYQEISALIEEGKVSGTTATALFELIAQQTIFSNQKLDVYGKISALQELALAFGITADAALGASQAINLENQLKLARHYGATDEQIANYSSSLTSQIEDAIKEKFGNLDYNYTGGNKSNKASGSKKEKKEKDTTKEFDWIENAIASLEKRIQSLQKVIDSSFSTTEAKSQALVEQIDLINQEIELQQKAYDAYMAKAESVGLSDKYKNLIQNGSINIEDITDEELQKAIDSYTEWYDKAQETLDSINELHEDAMQKHVDGYELEVEELEKIRDNGGMTEKEYLNAMTKLWKRYFDKQVDYAVIAKEKKLALLKDEKDYLESVVDAATNLLDDEIDSVEKAKDNATKGYKAEIKVLEDKIKVVEEQQEALENQISLIEEQKDAQQEILNNLEKERTKQNEILDVEQKRFNLKRAENQNKIKQYQDGQIVYTNDSNEIKNARQELDDAEFAFTKRGIQDVIDQYDKQIDNINKQIDGLDKVIDGYNKQIDALNDLIDKSDAYYDGQITNLENIKSEWEKLLEIEQRATDMKNFTDMFGEGSIAKLLTGDMSMLTQWKDTYASTLAEIDLTTQDKIGSITEKFAELAGVDLNGIVSQFDNLNQAVEDTSAAISGGATGGANGSQSGQTGNSLVGAIDESYNVASDKLPAEADLVDNLTDSVNEASSAIAGGGSTNNGEKGKKKENKDDSNSLTGAMDESYNKASETIPSETEMMDNLKDTTIQATDEVVRLGEEINNLPDEKVIKIKIETEGTMPNGFANGTVGNAFASGTHYKGLAHDEKNALRSEYGQPELTVYPNGKAELTTEPTMSDLPKDTVIFNEEQTKRIMNNKPETVSTAYEGGTVKKVGLPSYLRPIQEGDPWFDLVQKVEANRDKLVGTLVPPVTAIEKNLEMMARNINNVNNNSVNSSPTINMTVNCPGITSKEVADQVGAELEKAVFGMNNKALQRVNITR